MSAPPAVFEEGQKWPPGVRSGSREGDWKCRSELNDVAVVHVHCKANLES